MGLTNVVSIHMNVDPYWPDECVRCGIASPGHVYTAPVENDNWYASLLPGPLGRTRMRLRVPACLRCARRMTLVRVARSVGMLLAIVLVTFAVVKIFRHYGWLAGHPARKLVVFLAVMLAMVPAVLLVVFVPPVVHAGIAGDTVDYEFRNEKYARRFVQANTVVRVRATANPES